MANGDTFWLTVANLAMGVVVGIFVLGLLGALVLEVVARRRHNTIWEEIDRDMRRMFPPHHG